ncbi:hypothetical protein [Phytomonospora endophytica]|uniref:Secreted protein n=1 Tax=Phytomonospora endophytica TaxID=714109 RepID=A0A841F9K8_9ACTN|nr:hypothetical protein [Phytomonospora endophytica]MBB6033881.1 hypothetical protein [Phytomonospora endophytica]GIG64599.1 hypothetical protein Pen01_08940 [Phytomonospora endophytica]
MLFAVTCGAFIAQTPSPAHAAAPKPGRYKFSYEPADPKLLGELDEKLPNASVGGVLDGANRSGRACEAPVERREVSFCWNDDDAATRKWMPQGITTSADATADGSYQGREVLITSWYDTASGGEEDKGARITFIDVADPAAPVYRHVILAAPTHGDHGASFTPIRIHAGGLAWYGDRLYVADTWRGIRVFDLSHIWRVDGDSPELLGLQPDGTYQGYGYAYVLGQSGLFRHSTDDGEPGLRFSFLSVDRTGGPDALLAGEFAEPGDGTRLARIPLGSEGMPARGDDGFVRCEQIHVVGIGSMQGVAHVGDRYLFATSDGDGNGGDLSSWTPGGKTVTEHDVFPPGPEDLSYWGPDKRLWSLSEHPGQRFVYAISAG